MVGVEWGCWGPGEVPRHEGDLVCTVDAIAGERYGGRPRGRDATSACCAGFVAPTSADPTPIPLPGRFLAAAQLRPLSGRGGIRFGLRYGSLRSDGFAVFRYGRAVLVMASRFFGTARSEHPVAGSGSDRVAVCARARSAAPPPTPSPAGSLLLRSCVPSPGEGADAPRLPGYDGFAVCGAYGRCP